MAKTRLFVIRHGRTMFNTIGRAQGWSDTPLTAEGERGIQALGIGLRESGLEFTRAYSSDSGRAIQTMGIIHGVVPRVLDVEDYKTLTLEDLADGICQVDTANWAEPWEVLKSRILEGFEAIAKEVEENGGGNALVVSHSWTIQTLVCLIEGKPNLNLPLSNGSVTLVEYEDGVLTVKGIGDSSYREVGESLQES